MNKKLLIVSNSFADKTNHIGDAFKQLENVEVSVENLWLNKPRFSLAYRVFNKLKIPYDGDGLNKRLLKRVDEFLPDIIFIIKGLSIYPWVLKKIKKKYPQIKLISWAQDDMYAWHNRSIYYTLGIKHYDLVVTQKSYNVSELKSIGAKKVLFQNKAYSKQHHIPYDSCEGLTNNADVLFIGYAEKERFESMNYLAMNGIKIDIYGSGWDKEQFAMAHKNLNLYKQDLVGESYAKALSCYKISLCFLRKLNRDLQTSRSVEIPACKGFMVAERTDEQKSLFIEDKEAVYFDNNKELLEKVTYYLKEEKERVKIAEAGYRRCLSDDYSYENRCQEILELMYE